MNVLGISAFYHDSACALVRDGVIVAAAQEERFTRKKHDYRFPKAALQYCLDAGGIGPESLDYVAFYDKPLLKFERLLETYLAYAPRGFASFRQALPLWLKQKLFLPREMSRGLDGRYRGPFVFTEHHESHAASAFFPSPFDAAAVVTLDGVGEWATSTIGVGRGNRIELLQEQRFPHSLGLLYSAFTYYTGFRVNSGEYKLMGLAPYGEPRFAGLIRRELLDLKEDGSFRMDMRYFNYCEGLTMTNERFHRLFGMPPRPPEAELTEFYMDVAASIQQVTEEIVMAIARHARRLTGLSRLCLAGGVALNCVSNGKILEQGIFDDVWIQPAAGDAGGAVGAALFVWHQLLEKPRTSGHSDQQQGSLLGPGFTTDEVAERLRKQGAVFTRYETEEALCDAVAGLIASEKVVGWFQGRAEFGPRALGGRSILGDARSKEMQRVMNVKIKFRESFRPFAPSVLREHVSEYFSIQKHQESPYMLLVAKVHPSLRRIPDASASVRGLAKLKQVRSTLPAVTHVDDSARIQTVDAVRNPRYHRLLESFHRRTGCPVLINTSFNVRGEPIVGTPEDAYRCFMATNMDALAVENCLLLKADQPQATTHPVGDYLAQFQPD